MRRYLPTLLCLLQTVLVGQSQQAPTVASPGSIEGFVVRIGTSAPIARAGVVLAPTNPGAVSLRATTDGGGKFVFGGVPAGTYRMFVARDGFVRAEYGQSAVGRPGLPVSIAPGQNLKDVLLTMTPTGAISGRVYDRYGGPLVNADVYAMEFTYADGQRNLSEFQTARTNDLGEYRLYWLEPGEYVVRVVPTQSVRGEGEFVVIEGGPGSSVRLNGGIPQDSIRLNGRVASSLGYAVPVDAAETCLPIYYPGTIDPAMAAPINLLPGADFTGVDLTLGQTRSARITGYAVHGISGQVLGLQVTLSSRNGNNVGSEPRGLRSVSQNSPTGPGRPFDFRCVPPGSYDLVARWNDGPAAVRVDAGRQVVLPESTTPPRTFIARVPIEVGSADIENLTIALQPAFSIRGKVAIEGPVAANRVFTGMRMELRQNSGPSQVGVPPSNISADGTFTLNGLGPGDYRLRFNPGGFKGFIKSARLAGIDVLNTSFRLERPPDGDLEVVLSPNGGTLDIGVVDNMQRPASNVTVVLVPDSANRQAFELYRNGSTDGTGRLRLENLSPGLYKVFAWAQIELNAWQYPDYLRQYEALGSSVSIGEGSAATLGVNLIMGSR